MSERFVVILAGGAGTRFWPASRALRPKQLLPIAGKRPMIVETVERVRGLVPPRDVYVVTHEEQARAVRKLLPRVPAGNVLAEPVARNTAASIGWAAVAIGAGGQEGTIAVLPADHAIETKERFRKDLDAAFRAAESGGLVTFGIRPSYPTTGYGYLEQGERLGEAEGRPLFRVRRFAEKPDRATAEGFLASGRFFWNSGMFVWRLDAIRGAIERHLPALDAGLKRIAAAAGTRRFAAALRKEYRALEPISIDYGVMEKAKDVRMLVPEFRWSDVGSWAALAELLRRPGEANAAAFPRGGEFFSIDSRGCLVFSDGPHLVAGIGLEGLAIVRTEDATLVCRLDRAEEVKKVVEELQRRGRQELL